MPESTKQNKPEQHGGRLPNGVKRVSARPMGVKSACTKGGK